MGMINELIADNDVFSFTVSTIFKFPEEGEEFAWFLFMELIWTVLITKMGLQTQFFFANHVSKNELLIVNQNTQLTVSKVIVLQHEE